MVINTWQNKTKIIASDQGRIQVVENELETKWKGKRGQLMLIAPNSSHLYQ